MYFVMDENIKNLHFRRALIFQDLALVERAMNRFIYGYYFENDILLADSKKFIPSVLQDPFFSFELRKRLFKRIYDERYSDRKFPWASLQKIQELRNVIAHARIDEQYLVQGGERVAAVRKPYYVYHDIERDVASVHNEFKEHMDKVVEGLNKITAHTKFEFHPEPIITIQ